MPKMKMTREEKEIAVLDESKRILKKEFFGAVGKISGTFDMVDYEIAKIAGFPQSTFSVKKRKPETFSIEEMFKLIIKFPEIRESFINAIPKV